MLGFRFDCDERLTASENEIRVYYLEQPVSCFLFKPHNSTCMEFPRTSEHIFLSLRLHECCRDFLNTLEYVEPLEEYNFNLKSFIHDIPGLNSPRLRVSRLIKIPGPPIQKFSSNSSDSNPNSSLFPRPACPRIETCVSKHSRQSHESSSTHR